MAKLLFVVETFADVSSGTPDEYSKADMPCNFQIDWKWIFKHPFVCFVEGARNGKHRVSAFKTI